jgi:sodium/hydrogen exchanger 8
MNLILLPIIIFQAGWSMRHADFSSNFLYICIFAVLGTAISTLLIGTTVWYTGSWGWHVITGARESFALAALISATDPVAMLAAFAIKKVEPRLNIMVLGESTINDAVAIALFNMLNIDEPTAYWFFPSAAMSTFRLLFTSIAVGFVGGTVLVMLFRGVKVLANREEEHALDESTSFEAVYLLACAYLINAVAECGHMSGIIACLFGGITMGIYLRPHLSRLAEQHATYYISTAAETADLTVFIMVGVTTALIKSSKGFRFGAFLLLFCIVGRAVTVLLCGGICNVLHRARFGGNLMDFLSVPKLVMLWHAGLRGGIALTLALQLNDWCEHKAVLVTGTFIVIFALMVVMGSTIDFMLNLCKIEQGCVQETVDYKDLHSAAQDAKGAQGWLHSKVLHPMMVGDAAVQKQPHGV